MILKSKILALSLIIFTAVLMSSSCEGKHNEIDLNNLPEPIKIELRSSEIEMVRSDQSFAFNFLSYVYAEESAEENNSFMISPLSLSMALAMTMNGADGETKSVMLEALKLKGFLTKRLIVIISS